ncbi:MAG: PQQ-binding-like beta-propeller repeat protein [Candidatus Eremiobacteraeota bacterium]|nr:PQQ-binding-like beta-propeller repeat protein [Candidatus Eremiobacteraeota bacterium]MBV9646708.1 PQQ-binding-like beta-propeller repeat protein [Candidatus Eremiobacteraeota bacterium]
MDVIRFMRACALALGIVAATGIAADAAGPQIDATSKSVSWPQTYHDAGHTGYNPVEKMISPSNVAKLQQSWGLNFSGQVYAMVIDSGTLFVEAQQQASGAPYLFAFDLASHNQKWSVDLGSAEGIYPPVTTMAAAHNRVFAMCGGPSSPGGVCAYSEGTGKLLWSFIPTSCCALTEPLVYSGGVVYAGFNLGNNTAAFYAVNATTGKQVWGSPGAPQDLAPVVGGGLVFYDCNLGTFSKSAAGICAVHQADGTPAWQVTLNDNTAGKDIGLTFGNGTLYAHTAVPDGSGWRGEMVALNPSSGTQLWLTQYGSTCSVDCYHPFPGALTKKAIYISGFDGVRYAFNATTGTLLWQQSFGGPGGSYPSSPSVANGVVYANAGIVGSNYALLTAYSASNGKILWTSPQPPYGGSTLEIPPIILNGNLYAANGMQSGCELCVYALGVPGSRSKMPTEHHFGIVRP